MLNVIIIDDESVIRNGLKTLIDWNSYGFEVSDDAANGQEGLEKISKGNFDLAIVDIKMPLMDGLTMIEHLKASNISCHFILLTAYSDFKSAQQAISLGVYAYLLKPIAKKELIEKLQTVQQTLLLEKETTQKLKSYTTYEKNIFINEFMNFANDLEIDQINATYGFNFPWLSYSVAIIHFQSKERMMMLSIETLYNTIKEFIEELPNAFTFYTAHACAILFEPSTHTTNRLYRLQTFLSQKFNTSVLICIGNEVQKLEDLSLSFHSATSVIKNRFLYEYKGLLYASDLEYEKEPLINTMDFTSFSKLLFEACEVGNSMIVNNLLEKLKDYFQHDSTHTESFIKISYVSIYTNFSHLVRLHINTFPESILTHHKIINEIEEKNTLQELHAYFKYLLISFISELGDQFSNNDIHSILNYINKHYNEPLKLDTLAQQFGYNSTYLGKLIKKHTGYNFNTYLDTLRIEYAKKLLLEGMKVFETCEHVGFCDTDYFTKKFKKYVGTTPSQYKACR